jgi:hypothetical protein
MITVVYVNTNYDKDYPIAEVPDRADTLVLFDNNTYTSPLRKVSDFEVVIFSL